MIWTFGAMGLSDGADAESAHVCALYKVLPPVALHTTAVLQNSPKQSRFAPLFWELRKAAAR